MSKLFVNKSVFWSANGSKLAGKVKSIMSDHVLVVTPDGTQHIVSSSILSTKPLDKLALLSMGMTKEAAEKKYSEEELQNFLEGLNITIIRGKNVTLKVDAIDAPGAPSDQHSTLLTEALEAISGGKGQIRLTDAALDRKDEEQSKAVTQKPVQLDVIKPTTPVQTKKEAPLVPPTPPKASPKARPQQLGPMGG